MLEGTRLALFVGLVAIALFAVVTPQFTGFFAYNPQLTIISEGESDNMTYFNNSLEEINVTFLESGTQFTAGIELPKNANVTSASLNITGTLLFSIGPINEINSSASASAFGTVASAGDLNADGYDDIVVGADDDDSGSSNSGRAFLFLGGPSGIPTGNATFIANATLNHSANGDEFGYLSVSADFNNDTYSDVVISAPRNGSNVGALFGFLGGPNGIDSGDVHDIVNFTINGLADYLFGLYAYSTGDINGDTYDDLLVGAHSADKGTDNTGAALIFFGGPAGITSGNATIANVTINGSDYKDYLHSVGSGDFNGDGQTDVAAGAYLADGGGLSNSGEVYVFLGPLAHGLSVDAVDDADALISGSTASDFLGNDFVTGDFNADGYDDLVTTAHYADPTADRSGQAYVFFGGPTGIASGDAVSTANVTFNGSNAYDALGDDSFFSAGDFNADGTSDLFLSAINADPNAGSSGQAYLFLGPFSDGQSYDAVGDADYLFNGSAETDYLGKTNAFADVNNDGYDDLFIAIPNSDVPGSNAGQLIFYLANTSYTSGVTVDVGSEGTQEWNQTGHLNATHNISGFANVINSYLSTCTPTNGNCTVPISIATSSPGEVGLSLLSVKYGFIDRTLPNVEIQSPSATNYSSTNISLNFTIWDDSSNIDSCWYSNDAWSTNTTLTNCENTTVLLSEGSNTLLFAANDTSNNLNISASVTFLIDTTPPFLAINDPISNFNTTSSTIGFNISLFDSSREIDQCWYSLDDWATNTTIANCANATVSTLSEGSNTLLFASNDTLGNLNTSSSAQVTLDTTPPVVLIQTPSASQYDISNITFNFTASDALLPIDSCWYSTDSWVTNTTLENCTNTTLNLADASYLLKIAVNDTLNNLNSTTSVNFTADTTAPDLVMYAPTSATKAVQRQLVNFTVSDLTLESCWYVLNSATTVINCTNVNITSAWGSNSFILYANDSLGHINSTSVSFSVLKANGESCSAGTECSGAYCCNSLCQATSCGGGGGGSSFSYVPVLLDEEEVEEEEPVEEKPDDSEDYIEPEEELAEETTVLANTTEPYPVSEDQEWFATAGEQFEQTIILRPMIERALEEAVIEYEIEREVADKISSEIEETKNEIEDSIIRASVAIKFPEKVKGVSIAPGLAEKRPYVQGILQYSQHHDLDLHAYDEQGRHVGENYDTNTFDTEIPGVVYSGDTGTTEFIAVPSETKVTFTVDARQAEEEKEDYIFVSNLLDEEGDVVEVEKPVVATIEKGKTTEFTSTVSSEAGEIKLETTKVRAAAIPSFPISKPWIIVLLVLVIQLYTVRSHFRVRKRLSGLKSGFRDTYARMKHKKAKESVEFKREKPKDVKTFIAEKEAETVHRPEVFPIEPEARPQVPKPAEPEREEPERITHELPKAPRKPGVAETLPKPPKVRETMPQPRHRVPEVPKEFEEAEDKLPPREVPSFIPKETLAKLKELTYVMDGKPLYRTIGELDDALRANDMIRSIELHDEAMLKYYKLKPLLPIQLQDVVEKLLGKFDKRISKAMKS